MCTTLTEEYELILEEKTQSSVNIDDLLIDIYHLMTVIKMQFVSLMSASA